MSRPVCARRLADEQVKPVLLEVFNTNDRVYGRRKMKAALRRQHGINLDKDRIARLMRELGITWGDQVEGHDHDPPGSVVATGS
jgi:transposase